MVSKSPPYWTAAALLEAERQARARRRHRSVACTRRAQRAHRRPAHPDGAADCACERSVWGFEQRQVSQHRHHYWMCHPNYRDTHRRAWVERYMTRWGLAPRPWMLTAGI